MCSWAGREHQALWGVVRARRGCTRLGLLAARPFMFVVAAAWGWLFVLMKPQVGEVGEGCDCRGEHVPD